MPEPLGRRSRFLITVPTSEELGLIGKTKQLYNLMAWGAIALHHDFIYDGHRTIFVSVEKGDRNDHFSPGSLSVLRRRGLVHVTGHKFHTDFYHLTVGTNACACDRCNAQHKRDAEVRSETQSHQERRKNRDPTHVCVKADAIAAELRNVVEQLENEASSVDELIEALDRLASRIKQDLVDA